MKEIILTSIWIALLISVILLQVQTFRDFDWKDNKGKWIVSGIITLLLSVLTISYVFILILQIMVL